MSSFTQLEMTCGPDEYTAEALNAHRTVTATFTPASHRVPALEAPVEACESVWLALEELHWSAYR